MGCDLKSAHCVENATANKCTIKRVQHETGQNLKSKLKKVWHTTSATGDEWKRKKLQRKQSATRKGRYRGRMQKEGVQNKGVKHAERCNMKRMQHEKRCNMKRVHHEKSSA